MKKFLVLLALVPNLAFSATGVNPDAGTQKAVKRINTRFQTLKNDPDWIALTNQEAQFDAHYVSLTNSIAGTTGATKTALNDVKSCLSDNNVRLTKIRRLLKDVVTE